MPDDRLLPIPPLRDDLEAIAVEEDGETLILLRDPSGYAEDAIALRPEAWALISLCDGTQTVESLQRLLSGHVKTAIPAEAIRHLVETLDRHLLLQSEDFFRARERSDTAFQRQSVRRAAHAGKSYPGDPAELRNFFDAVFAGADGARRADAPCGIICPHIDLQVGPKVYVPGFEALRAADFDCAVVLGTSHYSSEDLFILTEKDFETPLGSIRTDREFVRAIHEEAGNAFTRRDVAHRPEHSIEFPVLYLQYLFGNERISILPVLCASYENFPGEDPHPQLEYRRRLFLDAFRAAAARSGKKLSYVLSVDWSHIGRKFGDETDAADMLEAVRASDHRHFDALERADFGAFRDLVRLERNGTRIDGYSCISAFFELAHPARGRLLAYDQWHEVERASAVTFASMAFYPERATAAGGA